VKEYLKMLSQTEEMDGGVVIRDSDDCETYLFGFLGVRDYVYMTWVKTQPPVETPEQLKSSINIYPLPYKKGDTPYVYYSYNEAFVSLPDGGFRFFNRNVESDPFDRFLKEAQDEVFEVTHNTGDSSYVSYLFVPESKYKLFLKEEFSIVSISVSQEDQEIILTKIRKYLRKEKVKDSE